MVLVHSSSLAPLRHARAPLLTLTSDPSVDDLHSCFYLAQLEGRGPITFYSVASCVNVPGRPGARCWPHLPQNSRPNSHVYTYSKLHYMLAQDITPRYKTELCRFHGTIGGCGRGDKCTFAHGERELRSPSERSARHTSTDSSPGSLHATGSGVLYRGSPVQACPELKTCSNILSPAQNVMRQKVHAQLSSGTASAAHNWLRARRDEHASAKFAKCNKNVTLFQEIINCVYADVEGESRFQCLINFEETTWRFKTEFCRNYRTRPRLQGNRSKYAHGSRELRSLSGGLPTVAYPMGLTS
eukprot:jgi/Botrbrau1/16559/Bobra.0385s0002.1